MAKLAGAKRVRYAFQSWSNLYNIAEPEDQIINQNLKFHTFAQKVILNHYMQPCMLMSRILQIQWRVLASTAFQDKPESGMQVQICQKSPVTSQEFYHERCGNIALQIREVNN